MAVNEIQPLGIHLPLEQQKMRESGIRLQGAPSFAETVKEFIGDVNNMRKESAQLTERFIKGEPVDLHNVMISAEKAKTAFQLLLELRNKGIDLYREVLRMQV